MPPKWHSSLAVVVAGVFVYHPQFGGIVVGSEAWMSPAASSAAPPAFRLAYVTDVEGNLDYLEAFAKHVRPDVLQLTKSANATEYRLDLVDPDTCYFVYGGDVMDKGPGDVRLCRALVDLKRRHSDRVFLLVGNRDLNKLRLTAELSDADVQHRSVDDIPPPHWDPHAPTLRTFLSQRYHGGDDHQATQDSEATTSTQPLKPPLSSLEQWNTRVNRLHYLLQHTLGCPDTFEFRRQELAILRGHNVNDSVTDEQVVDSFLYEVEHGCLADYLSVADVAVCIGNTLFCHGAVDRQTMRYVPRLDTAFGLPIEPPAPAALVDHVPSWTAALNDFLRQGWQEYRQQPHWNADRTARGGQALLALQNRPAVWGRSIVSNCYGDGGCITTAYAAAERQARLSSLDTCPTKSTAALAWENVCSDPADAVVAAWLRKDGIQRVVVGHKPTGDCPAVLSALYTGVEVVSADTSYADPSSSSRSPRGVAATAVHIVGQSAWDNQLELVGTLRDGQPYHVHHVRLHPNGIDTTTGDVYLGTQLLPVPDRAEDDREEHEEKKKANVVQDGWWVKAKVLVQPMERTEEGTTGDTPSMALPDDHHRHDYKYYLTRGSGRRVEYTSMSARDVARHCGAPISHGKPNLDVALELGNDE